jgi:hypothetical protein
MTNTERLIATLNNSMTGEVLFTVGRWTGNGPSVVAALRRRGYTVTKSGSGYRLTDDNFLAALGPCGK